MNNNNTAAWFFLAGVFLWLWVILTAIYIASGVGAVEAAASAALATAIGATFGLVIMMIGMVIFLVWKVK